MNLRAPYSPPLPARKAPPDAKAAHFRHDHTHPQIFWNHRFAAAGRGVVVAGHDRGADAVAGEFRTAAGDFLCGSRHRLGIAGDADHQLDVAARRLGSFSARMLAEGNVMPESITRMTRSERCRP